MTTTHGYASFDAKSGLRPHTFERREPGPNDVQIDILFAGICHSDLHTVRGEWGPQIYPLVPGHEIVGKVARVGSAVKNHKVGDTVGVGCLVGSCGECVQCKRGEENYCEKGATFTYGSKDRDGTQTQGGYSQQVVVDNGFVVSIPKEIPLAAAAPLLCAGITTYSPLKRWKVGKGHKMAVIGLGGLGHMGVKLGAALGADVSLISTSPKKQADAERLGARGFLLSNDSGALAKAANSFDFILDTVSAPHDINGMLGLLRTDGAMVLVGAPPQPTPISAFSLLAKRKTLAGSMIGGILETQECLNFCAEHKLAADIELIQAGQINDAYERMLKGDVKYRFVIDAKSFAV
jgi:uncharacterized zinc-type alcohol dehydrogenase-like protein